MCLRGGPKTADDYAVHMHMALRCARGRGESTRSVLDALALPLFQAFLLNAAGFAVLLFSGIPALRHVAGFALLTLGTGLMWALLILPLCPGFDRPPLYSPRARVTAKHPRFWPVLGCCVFLVLVGLSHVQAVSNKLLNLIKRAALYYKAQKALGLLLS